MNETKNPFELLLNMEIQKPMTKDIRIKRLSDICGEDVIFKVKEISYNKIREIQKMNDGDNGEMELAIVLEGVIEPKLRDSAFMDKYGCPTPIEAITKMLSAGEISDISRTIERLSGYRYTTIEVIDDIKKK